MGESAHGGRAADDRPLDVAVVGGGVAGCFVAYRLAELRPEWSLALFEQSARVGGRLLSLSIVTHLVAGSGIGFEERGIRTLKGIPGEWQVFAVTTLP